MWAYNRRMGLMFRKEDRGRVGAGEITVSYRLWQRAQVKAGGTYESPGVGQVLVEAVDVLPAAMVPREDVARSGFSSVQAIWDSAGEHTGAAVTGDTLLHRVQFRVLGAGGGRRRAR